MTDAQEANLFLLRELSEAMARNPGLNIRAVLDLAVTTFNPGSSCHNKTNTQMCDYLAKYNDMRNNDAARYHIYEVWKGCS